MTLLGVSSLLHFQGLFGLTELCYDIFAVASDFWLNILGLAACGILGLLVKRLLPLVSLYTASTPADQDTLLHHNLHCYLLVVHLSHMHAGHG